MMKKPRIVIGAPHSGSGKTTLTLAVMKLLVENGYTVQGFKVGPDYIDTSYYEGITKRPGRNLDTWMTSESMVKEFFQRGSKGADISVIEGVMGLFDGYSGSDDRGSTAHIARELNAPVILVVDASSQARSVAALLYGFSEFDPEVEIKGVIFNRVGSKSHFTYLKEAVISSGLDIEIIGYFPREEELTLPERHLGLVPYGEQQKKEKELDNFFNKLSELANSYLETEKLTNLAHGALFWDELEPIYFKMDKASCKEKKGRVAIARDEAFSFYYQENIEWLEEQGLELVNVSPLHDSKLPSGLKGIYLGGGFPELFAPWLRENKSFMVSFLEYVRQGIPILAECGGLMYLCEKLKDKEGNKYSMLGIVPAVVEMKDSLKALGYREGKALKDSFLLKKGEKIRGHEFRYSQMIPTKEPFPWAYELEGRFGKKKEGYLEGNVLASYFHVHLASNPEAGKRWVKNL